jgi:hypothetical protein
MDGRQPKVGRLETLIAVAIAVGMLKGQAAPAPPKAVTAEHREPQAPKPLPRHRAEPSLGF